LGSNNTQKSKKKYTYGKGILAAIPSKILFNIIESPTKGWLLVVNKSEQENVRETITKSKYENVSAFLAIFYLSPHIHNGK
jgi:hypothetical protein